MKFVKEQCLAYDEISPLNVPPVELSVIHLPFGTVQTGSGTTPLLFKL
jgi:hypothetical protein